MKLISKPMPFLQMKCRYSLFKNTAKNTKVGFPYLFGGFQEMNVDNKYAIGNHIMRNLFSQNKIDDFIIAYKKLLVGLLEQNQKYLKETLEPTLFQRISNKHVLLVNENAHVSAAYGNINAGFGIHWDKRKTSDNLLVINPGDGYATTIDLQFIRNAWKVRYQKTIEFQDSYKPQNITAPLLFEFDLFFKSRMKLIEPKDSENSELIDEEEVHQVAFQVEIQKKGPGTFRYLFDSLNIYRDMILNKEKYIQLVPKDYEWRISNIDFTMKRKRKRMFFWKEEY